MPKIGNYTEQSPANADSELIHSKVGETKKSKLKNLPFLPFVGKMVPIQVEFLSQNADTNVPFVSRAITSGTFSQLDTEDAHPGIWRITSAAGANSGGMFGLHNASAQTGEMILFGGEKAEFVIRLQTTSNITMRFGFHDENTLAANPTDAAWINISGTTLTGQTRKAGSGSTTSTSYTVSASTWYRLLVDINEAASLVTFYVYDMSETLLWSDSLSANIPTAGTDLRAGAIKTTAGATAILDIDYISMWSIGAKSR